MSVIACLFAVALAAHHRDLKTNLIGFAVMGVLMHPFTRPIHSCDLCVAAVDDIRL